MYTKTVYVYVRNQIEKHILQKRHLIRVDDGGKKHEFGLCTFVHNKLSAVTVTVCERICMCVHMCIDSAER